MWITVKNIEEMNNLRIINENDTVYCQEENQFFVWHNSTGYEEMKEQKFNGSFNVNYKDLLLMAIQDNEPINILDSYDNLKSWWAMNYNADSFLLYSREIGYFSILQPNNSLDKTERLFDIVAECLGNIGDVIYIEPDFIEEPQIIFWVRLPDNRIVDVYLFDCTPMIIEYNEV